MSGSKVLSFREQNSPGPLEEKLRVEDDRRLLRCTGAGSMLGSAFAAWALTVQIMLPPPLVDPPEDPHPGHFTAVPPKDYHGKIKDQRLVKNHVKPGQTGNKAPKPKTAHVAKQPGWLGQSLITSRTNRLDVKASELLSHAFKHLDVDKLTELPVLKRTAESRISGRRGAESHEFNIEYPDEGTGCHVLGAVDDRDNRTPSNDKRDCNGNRSECKQLAAGAITPNELTGLRLGT